MWGRLVWYGVAFCGVVWLAVASCGLLWYDVYDKPWVSYSVVWFEVLGDLMCCVARYGLFDQVCIVWCAPGPRTKYRQSGTDAMCVLVGVPVPVGAVWALMPYVYWWVC